MSAYERILDALAGHGHRIHRSSGQARAQCPAHGSRGLTLAVHAGEGRASLHCFAGCSDEDVLAALGLAVRDLFDAPGKPPEQAYAPAVFATPWDEAMRAAGLTHWPPVEHVCRRMLVEELKATLGPDIVASATDDDLNQLLTIYVHRGAE